MTSSAMPWIKLYTDTLNDSIVGQLPDHLWRRWHELLLIACEKNEEGRLPDVRDLTWLLRSDENEIRSDMQSLQGLGLIDREGSIDRAYFRHHVSLTLRWQELRRSILDRDSWTCRYCKQAANTVDHILPRCLGGTDDPDNLVAACHACNCHKWGRTPAQAGMELLDATLP